MIKLDRDEILRAFRKWYFENRLENSDRILEPFLNDRLTPYTVGKLSWLRLVRTSLFLSTSDLAARLKISRAGYSKYEQNEISGAITLATLSKVAGALDCELVYCIRPKCLRPLSSQIWGRIFSSARCHPRVTSCDPRKRSDALAAAARDLMKEPKFRKRMGWVQLRKDSFPLDK